MAGRRVSGEQHHRHAQQAVLHRTTAAHWARLPPYHMTMKTHGGEVLGVRACQELQFFYFEVISWNFLFGICTDLKQKAAKKPGTPVFFK